MAINNDKIITINNIEYGSLHGFNLKLNKDAISHSLFSLTHVKKLARIMIEEKINNFLNAPNESISYAKINEIDFNERLKERVLVMDGAMGTQIQSKKLSEDDFRGDLFKKYNKDFDYNLICLVQDKKYFKEATKRINKENMSDRFF